MGWTQQGAFLSERCETRDNYPRVNTDLQDFVEMPRRGKCVLFGVSSVTGELDGNMVETFTNGGTANVINTGKEAISRWDRVYACVVRPRPLQDTGDYHSFLGKSEAEIPNVSRAHLTAFLYPRDMSYTRSTARSLAGGAADDLRDIDPSEVFLLGTALMDAKPGATFGVLLETPRAGRLWPDLPGNDWDTSYAVPLKA